MGPLCPAWTSSANASRGTTCPGAHRRPRDVLRRTEVLRPRRPDGQKGTVVIGPSRTTFTTSARTVRMMESGPQRPSTSDSDAPGHKYAEAAMRLTIAYHVGATACSCVIIKDVVKAWPRGLPEGQIMIGGASGRRRRSTEPIGYTPPPRRRKSPRRKSVPQGVEIEGRYEGRVCPPPSPRLMGAAHNLV